LPKIKDDLQQLQRYESDVDITFWRERCAKLFSLRKKSKNSPQSDPNKKEASRALEETESQRYKSEIEVLRRNEQEAWRKSYEQKILEWQLSVIEEARKKLLVKLEELFDKMLRLQNLFSELGLEPGLLWDTSAATLCEQDIGMLRRWAKWLNGNSSVKQLCELMGRLRKEQKSRKREIIETSTTYCAAIPDTDSKEEIVGIELGNDLERLLPQELALLGDSETAILFDVKFVEKRLMCFAMQGYTDTQFTRTESKEIEIEEKEKMGPIILCIDTSGSMAGAPENIAKAITLSLATMAASQKRDCFLINFSTSIETISFAPPKGVLDLLKFLAMSFHGGTDVAPALHEAVGVMETKEYKNSDLLVISDFIMPALSEAISQTVLQKKESGNKFHSLAIGDFQLRHLHNLFDQQWIYNPATGDISEINNAIEHIANRKRHD
jgi:uncharacterized protein with von Willebrand factor type A (vWA) domain